MNSERHLCGSMADGVDDCYCTLSTLRLVLVLLVHFQSPYYCAQYYTYACNIRPYDHVEQSAVEYVLGPVLPHSSTTRTMLSA